MNSRAVAVVLGVVAWLLCWFRLDSVTRHTLWAEDARVFVSQSLAHPFAHRWFSPYEGYLHLVPRILADLVTGLVEVGSYATALTTASCTVVAMSVMIVWWVSADAVSSPLARGALALVPVLVPVAPIEVAGNLANVHGYVLWTAWWLLVFRPGSRRSAAVAAVAVVVCALSEVQVILLLPLGLLTWRHRLSRPVLGAAVVAVSLQVVTALVTPRIQAMGLVSTVGDVVVGFVANVGVGAWSADTDVLRRHGPLAIGVAATACAVLVGAALWQRHLAQGRLALLLLASSAWLWTVPYVINRGANKPYATFGPADWEAFGFLRYAVVPAMLLLAAVVVVLDAAWSRRGSRRVLVVALALALVLGWGMQQADALRRNGPQWPTTAEIEDQCVDWADVAVIAAAPPRWWAVLPCDAVRSGPRLLP